MYQINGAVLRPVKRQGLCIVVCLDYAKKFFGEGVSCVISLEQNLGTDQIQIRSLGELLVPKSWFPNTGNPELHGGLSTGCASANFTTLLYCKLDCDTSWLHDEIYLVSYGSMQHAFHACSIHVNWAYFPKEGDNIRCIPMKNRNVIDQQVFKRDCRRVCNPEHSCKANGKHAMLQIGIIGVLKDIDQGSVQ